MKTLTRPVDKKRWVNAQVFQYKIGFGRCIEIGVWSWQVEKRLIERAFKKEFGTKLNWKELGFRG